MVLCFTIGKNSQSCYLIQGKVQYTFALSKPGQPARIGCHRVGQFNHLRESRLEPVSQCKCATTCQEYVIKLLAILPHLTQIRSQLASSNVQCLSSQRLQVEFIASHNHFYRMAICGLPQVLVRFVKGHFPTSTLLKQFLHQLGSSALAKCFPTCKALDNLSLVNME